MDNIEKTINYEPLIEVNVDILDGLMNDLINQGIEIPVVKTVVALFKSYKSVSDYLMIKKLFSFLNECKNIDTEKHQKFIKKYVAGKEDSIGIKIMQIIHNLDEDNKATLVGKAYNYCVGNELGIDFYFKLCYLINKSYYSDILCIKQITKESILSKNKIIDTEVLEGLFSNGLLTQTGFDGGGYNDEDEGTEYALNKYSKVIFELL